MNRKLASAVSAGVVLVVVAVATVGAQQARTSAIAGPDRAVTCAPLSPLTPPTQSLRVLSGREDRKTLFATGESVVISGGTAQGVRMGDEYFVRRVVADRFTERRDGVVPISIQTAATVQVVDARNDVSVAVITFGCDAIMEGDYLDRYEPAVAPVETVGTTPDFGAPARLLLGAERRQIGAPGDFMVIDRGSDHGMRAGQALTLFRRTSAAPSAPVTTVGTAKVYLVQPQSSTVRIETSMDAVYVGDLVAIHR
jgi:hypothetical protein